jgi:hypothetical protein
VGEIVAERDRLVTALADLPVEQFHSGASDKLITRSFINWHV